MLQRRSIVELMQVEQSEHDIQWLKDSLQAAVELEFATLPPYLAAWWSIKAGSEYVSNSIRTIIIDEMVHMGLACNLLKALQETPIIDGSTVPNYPGPLPGGVNPALTIELQGLTPEAIELFMDIERPSWDPIGGYKKESYDTIGQFYDAIQEAFERLQPDLSTDGQVEKDTSQGGVYIIDTLDRAKEAIELIKVQGEGSSSSPQDGEDLAHYYRFAEISQGRQFIKSSGTWGYIGNIIDFPDAYPMATVPEGGYQNVSPDVEGLLKAFNKEYTNMINSLQRAWAGDPGAINTAVAEMYQLAGDAVALMKEEIPDDSGQTYGPDFKYIEGN